jgi:TonB family protein
MKAYLALMLLIIPLNLSGQIDTIIFYSGSGRSVDSTDNPVYREIISKRSKRTFISITFLKKDEKWVMMYQAKIKKDTDSSQIISSISRANQITKRYFHKSGRGYLIKDYIGPVLIQEGFSKLIFPVIKSGRWRAYDYSTGELKAEESYSDNQMITNKYWINSSEYIRDVFYLTDKIAEFQGGDTALMSFISKHARYPKYAFNNNMAGVVVVRLIVLKDGTVTGIELMKKANKFLDMEALRIVKSIPDKWIPGEIENKKVNMLVSVPITFQIIQ